MQSNHKTSTLIPYQLPNFITEDPNYANFTLFLQAYYEWMEQQGNTLDFSKSLPNYMDVDTTTNEFLNYFVNDFMSYFPQDILADKTKVIKIAKQLYQSKGTPASFQFLFRTLYNSDVELFYTKDVVLKTSSGKWYISKSLKLATSNQNFLEIQNLRVFGNISKSIATVEAATYDGLKTEVFISNIERLFQSGETVTVVDSSNQLVYFLDNKIVPAGTVGSETLSALIVGQISQVLINSKFRGTNYSSGDPVVLYGGINPATVNPVKAIATVGTTTSGSVQRIDVKKGGYGFTRSEPNTMIGGANTEILFLNIQGNNPKAPFASIGGLDSTQQANATMIPSDSIVLKRYHYIGNIAGSSGANTIGTQTYATVGAITTITTNLSANPPITPEMSTQVIGTGTYFTTDLFPGKLIYATDSVGTGGDFIGAVSSIANDTIFILTAPAAVAVNNNPYHVGNRNYTQQYYKFANNATANANTTLASAFTFSTFPTFPISSIIVNNQGGGLTTTPTLEVVSVYNTDILSKTNLERLGILAPIQIINPGKGYSVNDKIAFIGGSGYGAYANVTSVAALDGAINAISFVRNTADPFPHGGMGYFNPPVVVVAKLATGKVTTSNTSSVVTGNGTSFSTQISAGSLLVSNTNIILGTVKSVFNANTIILTSNATTALIANSFYFNTSILAAPGHLGAGAEFTQIVNKIGQITSFSISENGEDYIAAPGVSLKIQDLIITNVASTLVVPTGEHIYQGTSLATASYSAKVDSIIRIQASEPANTSVYQLRVYNYTSKPVPTSPLKIDSSGATLALVPNFINNNRATISTAADNSSFDSANAVMVYGDGQAKANATFLNGLVLSNGQYLDSSGQPSSFDVLQSVDYNNYTYELTLSKEIEKYRDVLLNLLHPAGMKVIGRIAMSSENTNTYDIKSGLEEAHTLSYYSGGGAYASMVVGTLANPSNNIIRITAPNWTVDSNLNNFIIPNTTSIEFAYGTGNNDIISSLIISVNAPANTVTISENVWTYLANVAVVKAYSGNNSILKIQSLTNSYNIVNNGNYSNTMYPMRDIVNVGDLVSVNGVSRTVTSIDTSYTALTLNAPITGTLQTISLKSPGANYSTNDKIIFVNSANGFGAYANVLSVNTTTGAITSVGYVSNTANPQPLGGLNYSIYAVPTLVVANVAIGTITAANTSNAVTGTGTSFTTQLTSGAPLVANTNVLLGIINYISNDTTLYLIANSSYVATANAFYKSTAILSVPGINNSGTVSVSRLLVSNPGDIQSVLLFNSTGVEYYTELTTEDDQSITTEDGTTLLIG